jgi:hypothetical protein
MKRYTSYYDKLKCYVVDNNKLDIEQEQIGYYDCAESIYSGGAIDRLAEYENLGFTPEDIVYMAKFFKEHTSAEYITNEMKMVAKLINAEKSNESGEVK